MSIILLVPMNVHTLNLLAITIAMIRLTMKNVIGMEEIAVAIMYILFPVLSVNVLNLILSQNNVTMSLLAMESVMMSPTLKNVNGTGEIAVLMKC